MGVSDAPGSILLQSSSGRDSFLVMTTLAEIKAATDALSASDKQQLLLYLAARLQAQGATVPNTPPLLREQRVDWMAEDEAAMRRFHPNA